MRETRLNEFEEILSKSEINLSKLQHQCLHGCPDSNGIRAKTWKILLNYLPPNASQWKNFLKNSRDEYARLACDLVKKVSSPQSADHPLSSDAGSDWREFFEDNETLLQINKDCRRLYPEFDFFQKMTAYPCSSILSPLLNVNSLRERIHSELLRHRTIATSFTGVKMFVGDGHNYSPKPFVLEQQLDLISPPCDSIDTGVDGEAHWEVIQRILFIYCKINRGASYVQGMNEVLAPVYYIFANDPNPSWRMYAEADSFYCFNNLMVEIQANFNRNFDKDFGIGAKMEHMMHILSEFDSELMEHLKAIRLEPTYFAFRWITVLFTREFMLPDVLRLWDSILSDPQRFDLVLYIGCAMLMLIKAELMAGDFPKCIRLVQNYPYCDINKIIVRAYDLYKTRQH